MSPLLEDGAGTPPSEQGFGRGPHVPSEGAFQGFCLATSGSRPGRGTRGPPPPCRPSPRATASRTTPPAEGAFGHLRAPSGWPWLHPSLLLPACWGIKVRGWGRQVPILANILYLGSYRLPLTRCVFLTTQSSRELAWPSGVSLSAGEKERFPANPHR